MTSLMVTVILLIISNTFMTFAWYGHLKYRSAPIVAAIVVSWLIAFGEYCFQVPANRIGYGQFTAYQLKIIQESITLACLWCSRISTWGRRFAGTTSRRLGASWARWSWPSGEVPIRTL